MKFQECKCRCCEIAGFPILWRLSLGMFWYEIPKNGSSSIKYTLELLHTQDVVNPSDHLTESPIVVVRDPIERFIGTFNHYFTKQPTSPGRSHGRFYRGKQFCKRLGFDIEQLNATERMSLLIDNLDKLSTAEEVHHFYPQVHFIATEHLHNFTLVKLENLSDTLNVPVTNKSTVSIATLTEDQAAYIKDIYKDDYRLLQE